jgi:ribosomal-protein-alanine N-acetyltransferase
LAEIVLLIDATAQGEKRRKGKKAGDGWPDPVETGLCPVQAGRSPASTAHDILISRYNGGVPFRIRQFEKADFDTLWRIDQACFDPQLAYSRPEMAFYMHRPGSFTLVAEAEGGEVPDNGSASAGIPGFAILGFVVAETRRKSGHIITIDVVEEARRTGVGSALLRAAEEQLLRAGAVSVALETPVNNDAAIRFYKQKGYCVEKTVAGYYSNQMDALVMTKELARSVVR